MLTMSPGHVVLKGGGVTLPDRRLASGASSINTALGWTSPEFSGGGINNYYVVYAETRSFLLGRGGRGPSALTGAIEKGTGPGMARSGAGRRNPNMSGPSRTEAQTPAARHGRQPSGIACGRDWALGLGRLPREPGRTRRRDRGLRLARGAGRLGAVGLGLRG